MPNYALAKVYTIVNSLNDIIYVGSTAVPRLSTRMSGHRSHCKDLETSGLYTAMRALGVENFTIRLHHAFPCTSKDELVAEEMKTLDKIIAAGTSVYNNIIGGKFDAAACAKMSAAQKGKKHTDESKKNMSNAQKGHIVTDETKSKISEGNFGFGCIKLETTRENQLWRFHWGENGIKRSRSFSCKKYGDYGAHFRAEEFRKSIYKEYGTEEDIACDDLGHIKWD